jgi:hypothetical protein
MSLGTPQDPAPILAPPRHALGLPAGSVRAILALAVLGSLALIVLLRREDVPGVDSLYVYLWGTLFLIMASYFTARTHRSLEAHAGPHPLGLPRGSVRFFLIAGLASIVLWLWQTDHLFANPPRLPPGMVILVPGGFLVGWFVGRVANAIFRGNEPAWYQDVQAWIAIIAMGILVIVMLIVMFINPSMSEEKQVDTTTWDGVLVAVVSFYFGARM